MSAYRVESNVKQSWEMFLVILEKILLEFLHSETDNRYIFLFWYFFFFLFFFFFFFYFAWKSSTSNILRNQFVQLMCTTRRMVVLLVREEILDIYSSPYFTFTFSKVLVNYQSQMSCLYNRGISIGFVFDKYKYRGTKIRIS